MFHNKTVCVVVLYSLLFDFCCVVLPGLGSPEPDKHDALENKRPSATTCPSEGQSSENLLCMVLLFGVVCQIDFPFVKENYRIMCVAFLAPMTPQRIYQIKVFLFI